VSIVIAVRNGTSDRFSTIVVYNNCDDSVAILLHDDYRTEQKAMALVRLGDLDVVGPWPIVSNTQCLENGRSGCELARANSGPQVLHQPRTFASGRDVERFAQEIGACCAFARSGAQWWKVSNPGRPFDGWQTVRR
jgi:hypothetical protein